MGFWKTMARVFTVGGTARFVAKGFFSALANEHLNVDNLESQEGLEGELHRVAEYVLNARFYSAISSGNGPPCEYLEIMDFYEKHAGPGLVGLVIAILKVEAGFLENDLETQDMFREVIVEELIKKGVGERMLF